jgi:hypothetical protein
VIDSPALKAIAKLKLRELEKQRDALLAGYDAVEQRARASRTRRGALRALYRGLAKIEVAGEPMHPDCKNLEGVLLSASPRLVRAAARRLRVEMERGRFRSQVAFAFGALLTEWTNREAPPDPASAMLEAALARTAPAIDHAFLDRLMSRLELAPLRAAAAKVGAARHGVPPVIDASWIVRDREKAPELREEARLFGAGEQAAGAPEGPAAQRAKELGQVIEMLWADIDRWDWPEPVRARSVWTGDRFRLHPAIDLLTSLLLERVERELGVVGPHLTGNRANRLARLARLRELAAPEVIVANELRLLAETSEGLVPDPLLREYGTDVSVRSLAIARAAEATSLAWASFELSGDYTYSGNVLVRLAQLVAADVRVSRYLSPDEPVYVLKIDVRDFFPSLSHELVLRVLRDFGVPAAWVELVARVLRVPFVAAGGEVARPPVGVPLGVPLGRLLAEMVMVLVEAHLKLEARAQGEVQVFRLVDDLTLVTRSREALAAAWQAAREACAAMGLEVSAEKTGAVAVGGGALPESVPSTPPRWALLELAPDGELVPSRSAMREWGARLQARMAAAGGVLEKVDVYSAEMRALVQALGPSAAPGSAHRRRVRRAIEELERELGAKRALASLVGQGYLDGREPPAAWLHWPRTAGGLGLLDPMIELVQYPKRRDVRPPEVPAGWSVRDVELRSKEWAEHFAKLVSSFGPSGPAPHPTMDALARDFVSRLAEMKGKPAAEAQSEAKEAALAPYWRWVLATYGPEVLEVFGTYRFLLAPLVPLHLIQQRLVSSSPDVLA